MAKLIFYVILTLSINCFGQEQKTVFNEKDFDRQILNFAPVNLGIAEHKFRDATFILEQTKERISKNNFRFDFLDYWNVLVILNRLNESQPNLEIAFNKFQKAEGSCEYLTSPIFQKHFNNFPNPISTKLKDAASKCPNLDKTIFEIDEYIRKNKLDEKLVKLISKVEDNDQIYRIDASNQNKQKELDIANQKIIDSLYSVHKKYIGKTLVGERFENVMWQVVQHSNLKYMEKYLPIIHKAVADKEVNQTVLKYLLDRIASEKLGVQYFGSQGNVPIADKKSIDEIKKKYQIE